MKPRINTAKLTSATLFLCTIVLAIGDKIEHIPGLPASLAMWWPVVLAIAGAVHVSASIVTTDKQVQANTAKVNNIEASVSQQDEAARRIAGALDVPPGRTSFVVTLPAAVRGSDGSPVIKPPEAA